MAGVRTEVELLPFTLDVDRDPVQVDDPLVDEGVIDLYGVTVDIKCEWQKFDFSAHAGHDDLVRFIEACDPQRVILMHGENRQILADALEGRDVLLPKEGEWHTL